MNPRRWQQIKASLHEALELTPELRRAYIDRITADDAELREELESLIAAHDGATDEFLNTPAAAAGAFGEVLGPDPWVGKHIGAYQLIEEVGSGGMGEVYRAVRADDAFQKQVAIKLIRTGQDSAFVVQRFRTERQIMASFEHPNIARLLDGGSTAEGLPYFVMEFVKGEAIDRYCDRHQLDTTARLHLFLQVLAAVDYAHTQRVIHRDLKPSNILVRDGGEVVLLDFGIAKLLVDGQSAESELTAHGGAALTPHYASPEQIKGETLGPATDVYSLGVLLYELLCGRRPYESANSTRRALEDAILSASPRRPSEVATERSRTGDAAPQSLRNALRGDLDTIVLKSLKKSPAERYATAGAFAEDLRRYLRRDAVSARPDTFWYRVTRHAHRHRAALQGAALAGLAVAAVAAIPILNGGWPAKRLTPADSTAPAAAGSLPAAHPDHQAIVILPFVSSGESRETAYLAAGLTDEIAAGLSSIEDLRVVGRVSAARAQAARKSYQEIGRELNVGTVLEGSVGGHADEIAVTVRLINAVSGQVLRAKIYSGDFGKSRALQASVVNDIARALGLNPSFATSGGPHHEPSPEAYRLFLQGRYYSQQNNPGGFEQARDYLSQAVKVDGEFARAWAALATTNLIMIDFGNRRPDEATKEAQPAVVRALELEPDLADAQAAAGLLALFQHRYEKSAEALRRATSLRPSYSQAHMWLGRLFMAQREARRATTAFERAHELDPQASVVDLNLGLALDTQGRYDNAALVLKEGISNSPNFANLHWALAHVQSERGEFSSAAASYRRAIDLGADYAALYSGYSILLSDMGDTDAALAALTHGESLGADDPTIWAARFNLAASTGAHEGFFDSIAAERQPKHADLWRELAVAKLELVRGDPRAALRAYKDTHLEQRMEEPELIAETDVLGGPAAILDMACAYQLTGDQDHANRLIERAEQMLAADRARGIDPDEYDYLSAAAAAMRGDQTRALAQMRLATNRGWRRYAWFKIDPRFSRFKDRSELLPLAKSSTAQQLHP